MNFEPGLHVYIDVASFNRCTIKCYEEYTEAFLWNEDDYPMYTRVMKDDHHTTMEFVTS